MIALPCANKCGAQAQTWHHVVYQQEIRRSGGSTADTDLWLPLCRRCHEGHHSTRPLQLSILRSCNFRAAAQLLGPRRAYEYLRRRYRGEDPRLDSLLDSPAEDAEAPGPAAPPF